MKLTPVSLILIGLFSNFFGSFIVELYGSLIGLNGWSVVFSESKNVTFASVLDLIFVYCFILIYCLLSKSSKANEKIYRGKKNIMFYSFSIFFIVMIIFFTITMGDFNYDSRGESQFEGRGLISSIQRLEIFLFPLFVFYRLMWGRFKSARIISIIFYISCVIYYFSYGNRVIFLLLSLFYIFLKTMDFEKKSNKSSASFKFQNMLIILSLSILATLIYYLRVKSYLTISGIKIFQYLFYLFLDGTIGSIGISYIYPQVKYYCMYKTGYLYGLSFANYFKGIFIPTVVIYTLGGNEFYFRSSFYFNQLFNDNPDMGYDFMMIADFYWNFGYVGLVIYALLICLIIHNVKKYQTSMSPKNFGLVILVAGFLIVGQRSDFGVFLKNIVYCCLLYLLCYYVTSKVDLRTNLVRKNIGN